jgi:hypothetical protein
MYAVPFLSQHRVDHYSKLTLHRNRRHGENESEGSTRTPTSSLSKFEREPDPRQWLPACPAIPVLSDRTKSRFSLFLRIERSSSFSLWPLVQHATEWGGEGTTENRERHRTTVREARGERKDFVDFSCLMFIRDWYS